MQSKESIETIFFANQQEWEAWLHEQGSTSPGVWLKLAKKETGIPSITYADSKCQKSRNAQRTHREVYCDARKTGENLSIVLLLYPWFCR